MKKIIGSFLVVALFATGALAADYDPTFKPRPLYDQSRPETVEERERRREERAVLRANGIRKRPLNCVFIQNYQYLPYDRFNISLVCGVLNIYR